MTTQVERLASGSVVMITALLVACGSKSPEPAETPQGVSMPPPPLELARMPASAWDSLQLDIEAAIHEGNAASAKRLRAVLLKFPAQAGEEDSTSGHDAFPGSSRTIRLYLSGELAAVAGDTRALQSATDTLMGPAMLLVPLPRGPSSYGMSLQSLALIRQGDTTRALEWIDKILARIPAEKSSKLWEGAGLDRQRKAAWQKR